jgi:succinyl-CoA synthetase beta subunit
VRLLEYEAKQLLEKYGVCIPAGWVVTGSDSLDHVSAPCVVKSQVPTGGRGKAGGVRVVQHGDLYSVVQDTLRLKINSYSPSVVLCEELLDIQNEYYLSIIVNRDAGCVELVAHKEGGVDVESHAPGDFFRRKLNVENADDMGDSLADYLGIPGKSFALQDLIEKLYRCFAKNDATLLEINPLILTKTGKLVAGDCKMTLDDAAKYRHHDWDFEEQPADTNFVTLDSTGTIATIANGAGLAMATVDAVYAAGLVPANFLDIGGGATTEKIVESFEQIMEYKQITAIIINIFGGIVRCDTVAQAIIEAREQLPDLPQLYICLSGNRSQEAANLLCQHGLVLYDTLELCLEELQV